MRKYVLTWRDIEGFTHTQECGSFSRDDSLGTITLYDKPLKVVDPVSMKRPQPGYQVNGNKNNTYGTINEEDQRKPITILVVRNLIEINIDIIGE